MIKKLDSIFARKVLEIHEKSIFPIWRDIGKKIDEASVERFTRSLFCKGEIYGYFFEGDVIATFGIYEKDEENLELVFILVLPEFQGRKIGKEIMNFLEEIAKEREYKVISFDVLASNYMAVNFYKKLGYEIIKEYIKDNFKKYFMEKKIG